MENDNKPLDLQSETDYHQLLANRVAAIKEALYISCSIEDYDPGNDKITFTINGCSLSIDMMSADVLQIVGCALDEIEEFAKSQLPDYTGPQAEAFTGADQILAQSKKLSTMDMLQRIESCQKALAVCAEEPGAAISIDVVHEKRPDASVRCVLYDHACLVQSLDAALDELKDEL
jgi:hypothetical protein